jgi:hypothetical protein
MNDGFNVVSLGYCDESDHMYKLWIDFFLITERTSCYGRHVDDTTGMLWHQHFGHTNFGFL